MTEWEKRLESKLCTVDCVMQRGAIEIIKEEIKLFAFQIEITKTHYGDIKLNISDLLEERGLA